MIARIDEWVDDHGMKIVIGLVMVISAWFTLKAQVAGKLDSIDFNRHVIHEDSLKTEILHQLESIRVETTQLHTYICSSHRSDLGCLR